MQGLLLFVVALILSAIFISTSISACFIIVLFKGRLGAYGREMAIAVDRFGNIALAPVLNMVMLKNTSKHQFGDSKETISSVMGRNAKSSNRTKYFNGFGNYQHLTFFGDILVFILSLNHCLDAIGN